jgi:hypothetical protein
MSVISDSVIATAATASGPSRATKNTSTTAKTLSISISSTIGTASSMMEWPMSPSV